MAPFCVEYSSGRNNGAKLVFTAVGITASLKLVNGKILNSFAETICFQEENLRFDSREVPRGPVHAPHPDIPSSQKRNPVAADCGRVWRASTLFFPLLQLRTVLGLYSRVARYGSKYGARQTPEQRQSPAIVPSPIAIRSRRGSCPESQNKTRKRWPFSTAGCATNSLGV